MTNYLIKSSHCMHPFAPAPLVLVSIAMLLVCTKCSWPTSTKQLGQSVLSIATSFLRKLGAGESSRGILASDDIDKIWNQTISN